MLSLKTLTLFNLIILAVGVRGVSIETKHWPYIYGCSLHTVCDNDSKCVLLRTSQSINVGGWFQDLHCTL